MVHSRRFFARELSINWSPFVRRLRWATNISAAIGHDGASAESHNNASAVYSSGQGKYSWEGRRWTLFFFSFFFIRLTKASPRRRSNSSPLPRYRDNEAPRVAERKPISSEATSSRFKRGSYQTVNGIRVGNSRVSIFSDFFIGCCDAFSFDSRSNAFKEHSTGESQCAFHLLSFFEITESVSRRRSFGEESENVSEKFHWKLRPMFDFFFFPLSGYILRKSKSKNAEEL